MNSAQLNVATGKVIRLKLPDPTTFIFPELEDHFEDPRLRAKEDHAVFDWPGG